MIKTATFRMATRATVIASLLLLASETRVGATIPSRFMQQGDEWFRSEQGRQIADNVVSWQASHGGWPKNHDTASEPFDGVREQLRGTFDNGATTGELRFLARAFRATSEARYREAFHKGLDHLLEAQYPTGGWPQRYPPGRGYHRHITFNDHAMVLILEFLREVTESSNDVLLDDDRRSAVETAFDRGIQCILDSQVMVNDQLTVWCAQHDEVDLRPRPGRSYELVSLSGGESARILRLLMSLEDPSPEIRRAIHEGARWYDSVKLTGIRIEREAGDRRVVEDPDAPPLWARFYEIETNRPLFSGRDGIKRYHLSEIELERRTGYAWYGGWGKDVAKSYESWKRQWSNGCSLP